MLNAECRMSNEEHAVTLRRGPGRSFWDDGGGGRYVFAKSDGRARSAEEMVALYEDWVRQYPIISIEDGLAEGDSATTSSSPTPTSCGAASRSGSATRCW